MSRACRQQTSLRLWERNALALGWWDQWVASSALVYGPPGHTLVLWVNLPEGKSFSYSTFGFSGQRPRRLCERSRKDSSTETSGWAHFFGPWSFCGNWMAKIPVMGSCALLGVRLRLRVKKNLEKWGPNLGCWSTPKDWLVQWSSRNSQNCGFWCSLYLKNSDTKPLKLRKDSIWDMTCRIILAQTNIPNRLLSKYAMSIACDQGELAPLHMVPSWWLAYSVCPLVAHYWEMRILTYVCQNAWKSNGKRNPEGSKPHFPHLRIAIWGLQFLPQTHLTGTAAPPVQGSSYTLNPSTRWAVKALDPWIFSGPGESQNVLKKIIQRMLGG